MHRLAIVVVQVVSCCVCCAAIAGGARELGSRGVDWEQVRQKVQDNEWARAVVRTIEAQVAQDISDFPHPPLGETGWYHDYFCKKDAVQLKFDAGQPNEHACPSCGTVYTGPFYDACWRDSAHRKIGAAVRNSAILYRVTDKPVYADYVESILLWYARNLSRFDVHGEHAGKGRIMSQSLGEARLMAELAVAYWDIHPTLSEPHREEIITQLFLPETPFIHRQTRTIHNIHSWHNAAIGLIGYVSGQTEWVTKAIDGPLGLRQQIRQGCKEDGFWYEGSIGYHFYTILSLQDLYGAARAQGHALEGTEKFRLMYDAPIAFAFEHGEFPSLNDGWYGRRLDETAAHFERAAGLWPDSVFPQVLASLYREQPRDSVEALLFGPAQLPAVESADGASVLFKDSGIAILRHAGLETLLKFSPHGGGHDHNDRLNLVLAGLGQVLVPDLGTSGYGVEWNGAWYRASASHNLLVVDGKRQRPSDGYLIEYKADRVRAGVKDAYPGVSVERELALRPGGFADTVLASSDESHQYDLFYHVRGSLRECTAPMQPRPPLDQGNGYGHLASLAGSTCRGEAKLVFDLRDANGTLVLQCNSDHPYELNVGTCPDIPADRKMSVVILRRTAKAALWRNQITIDDSSTTEQ